MNLRKGELIGRTVVVTASPDPSLVGLRGTVSDETKNMIAIDTPRGEKRVPKKGARFAFDADGTVVRGDDILFRPEDRIKKAR